MFGAGWCGGMGVGGWVLMVSLWGSFLAVIVWAVMRLFPSTGTHPGSGESGVGVPDPRFGSGEIDEETSRRLRGEVTRTG